MLLLFLRWRPLPTQSTNKNLPLPIQGTLRFLFPIAIIEGTPPAAEPLRFLTQWVLKQWVRCIYIIYIFCNMLYILPMLTWMNHQVGTTYPIRSHYPSPSAVSLGKPTRGRGRSGKIRVNSRVPSVRHQSPGCGRAQGAPVEPSGWRGWHGNWSCLAVQFWIS